MAAVALLCLGHSPRARRLGPASLGVMALAHRPMYISVVESVADRRRVMSSREVYPNAPLRLVTAEFRFPLSPTLAGGDLLSALSKVLGGVLPIIEPVPQGLQVTF